MGSVAGFSIGGGAPLALAGAAIGAIVDKRGPKMAQIILQKMSKVDGFPTIRKIENLFNDMPDEIRQEMKNGFIRMVSTSPSSNKTTQIPPESVKSVSDELELDQSMSNVERAKAKSMLNSRGELPSGVLKKLILSGEKEVIEPTMFVSRKPKQRGRTLEEVSEFGKNRRAEGF